MFNSQYLGELGIAVGDPAPKLEFTAKGQSLVTFGSREIVYNHAEFPNDTAKQAAQRIFPVIKGSVLYGLTKDKPVTLNIRAYQDQPERTITFAAHGIEHNYDVTPWTWWMLHHLEELIKKSF